MTFSDSFKVSFSPRGLCVVIALVPCRLSSGGAGVRGRFDCMFKVSRSSDVW